jgi:hypothetical protein
MLSQWQQVNEERVWKRNGRMEDTKKGIYGKGGDMA